MIIIIIRGVGGSVVSESALRSAGTLLSRVRAPPRAPWPDGGPESLRSPCYGLAIYKNQLSSSSSAAAAAAAAAVERKTLTTVPAIKEYDYASKSDGAPLRRSLMLDI
ncbi:hypothetical protein PoB_000109200 [Plakobranchus ocellatus]|uniref:Uncharacterized protein n=1 Tax=Plakobranchus ocellatus TaxID=259542 RepID=A0AAV3XXM0_9GAST|nr:hypothetical protein PoB_000109200 [Plakobranchus ocellatus]